jgi:ribokinase
MRLSTKKRDTVMKPKIVVVGSTNTDMVIKAAHLPAPGETILGGTFFMNPGGKGANQAVSAARLGGAVTFISKTGNDVFGRQSVQLFEEEGIDTSCMLSDSKQPSGVALITVDDNAENCIVVASGANATLSPQDLRKAEHLIGEAAIVLMQLEIPVETVAHVASLAAKQGVKVVLNPAPVCSLPPELLRHVTIITPNSTEAEMLTGVAVTDQAAAEKAARIIREQGVETVIITLGARGALVLHEDTFHHVPPVKVKAVDTTAAGDVFNGALVVALSEGRDIPDAVAFACKASAIAVTRLGAQSSAPYRHEADTFATAE